MKILDYAAIVDGKRVYLVDVTKEISKIFGIKVERACIEFNDSFTLDEIKSNIKDIISENKMDFDGNTLYVKFKNGHTVSFYNSEWGGIKALTEWMEVAK